MSEIKPEKPIQTQDKVNPGLQREETLRRMGVRFELIFAEEKGWFRFETLHETAPGSIEPWHHEYFQGMKVDPKLLAMSGEFHEFAARNQPFHRDCFALGTGDFLVLVRPAKDPGILFVLVSSRSLQEQKAAILNLPPPSRSATAAESRGTRDYKAGDDDMKIEIA